MEAAEIGLAPRVQHSYEKARPVRRLVVETRQESLSREFVAKVHCGRVWCLEKEIYKCARPDAGVVRGPRARRATHV